MSSAALASLPEGAVLAGRQLQATAAPADDAAMPDPVLLRAGRVHEVCGGGRRCFAAALAGRLEGPVLWVQESRERDRLCPPGLAAFFDPSRLILIGAVGQKAVLAVLEEALRSGAVPLAVAELERSPGLTPGRRLQLAAGSGGGRGLVLVPENGVAAGAVETRWRCLPLPGRDAPQSWELLRDKRGRPSGWTVARGARGGWRTMAPDAPAGVR